MRTADFSRRVVRALAVVGLAVSLSLSLAAGGCKPKTDDLAVGAYLSLSGVDATFGSDTKEGIELALGEINAAGGVKGKKVRVIYEDDKSTPQEASNKVRQLIDRDGVLALIGEVASSRSMAGGLIANTKKIPMVTSSTAVEVTRDREYVFRTCPTDAQQGNVAAHFIRDTLKKANVGLFYVAQDNYSSGLAQMFKESFTKLGGKVVVEKGYQKGETNFTTYLQEIKAAGPDVIFTPVYYNDMIQIARQAKQVGIPGPAFVGGDGWDSQALLDGAGGDLEGAYFTNHYAPDVPWPNSQAFVRAFKERFKHSPSSLSAQGYDGARLLFDAMRRATDMTPEAIKTALAATRDFQGASGTLTIDAEHNATKPIVVVQIKDKAFTYFAELAAK